MSEIEALHARVIQQLRHRQVHDSDFQALAWIDRHVRPVRTVLDVGANGGQTIVSVRSVLGESVEIHSFEANPKLWPGLETVAKASGGAVHVHRAALGPEAGELVLHVPCSGGQLFLEESTFDPSQFDKPWVREKYLARGGRAPELVEMTVPVQRGDDCALHPDVIKIDVEGFEAPAIRGLLRTIVEHQPVLIVENSDWHGVTALLGEIGYRPFRWEDGEMIPFYGATTNTFYLPEKDTAAVAAVHAAELPAEQSRPQPQAEGGYSEAADVGEHLADVERMLQLLDSLNRPLPADGLALDVGGGAGGHSVFLANRVGRVYCTDYFDQNARFGGELIKLLKQKAARHGHDFPVEKLEFHAVDAMNTIYRDGQFDVVVSFNAFEHIPDPGAALREIVRVLKPGGMAYLTFDPIWTCDFGSHFQHRVPRPWQHLISDDAEFVGMIKQAGGSDEECQEYIHAMNRRQLAYYRELFESIRGQVKYLYEGEWSGCVLPDSESHENFERCLALGYSREELLLRGLVRVFVKPAAAQTSATPAAQPAPARKRWRLFG